MEHASKSASALGTRVSFLKNWKGCGGMERADTYFETVTTEELYNQDVLIQKSLDIFLDRLRSLHGNFQESDILGGPIITELANTMATTSPKKR